MGMNEQQLDNIILIIIIIIAVLMFQKKVLEVLRSFVCADMINPGFPFRLDVFMLK